MFVFCKFSLKNNYLLHGLLRFCWIWSCSPAGRLSGSGGLYYHRTKEGQVRCYRYTAFVKGSNLQFPRVNRVKHDPVACLIGKPVPMPGHSTPLAGLGGLIIVFGFLAFNGGSQAGRSTCAFIVINYFTIISYF